MPTTVDQLKDIGSTVAEAAKLNLTRSGSLLPVLMLVRDGDVEEIMGMAIPYHKNEVGEIVFDTVDALKDWHDGAEMNLLPDWWES
jgi:hypothetical protein